MARNFGKTWWGEQWLGALTHIDYANRIPRGASYARKGAVTKLAINKNKGEIKATVQGTRKYKVLLSLPPCSPTKVKQLINKILSQPMILSRLLNRELDPALLQIAQSIHLNLFPRTWNDLKMSCSCPDWAVPCKHIAAAIYKVSQEIDNNPFLIFELHGVDLLQEIRDRGIRLDTKELLSPVEWHTLVHPDKERERTSVPERFTPDMSNLPPMGKLQCKLLQPSPAFYDAGDFLSIYQKGTERCSRLAAKLQRYGVQALPPEAYQQETIYPSTKLQVRFNDHDQPSAQLSDNAMDESRTISFSTLFASLLSLNPDDLGRYQPEVELLYQVAQWALGLWTMGAVVPQIVSLREQSYVVHWLPTPLNEYVSRCSTELDRVLPAGLVEYQEGDQALPVEHPELWLTSFFLKQVQTWAAPTTLIHPVSDLLFGTGPVSFSQIGEKNIPGGIKAWTDFLFMGNQRFRPLLQVDETSHGFALSIQVTDTSSQQSLPIPLSVILSDKQYETSRYEILKDLSVLTKKIPKLTAYMNEGATEPVFLSMQDIVPFLFETVPFIQLLQAKVLLPQSMKHLIRPKVSVQLSKRATDSRAFIRLDDLLTFHWQIALGDDCLPPSEFEKLLGNASGLIRYKKQYIYVDANDLARIRKTVNESKPLSTAQMLQVALSGEYDSAPVLLTPEVKQLIQGLREQREIALPDNLHATLRPYQQRGYEWMYRNLQLGFGSIIADDMGLGKTLQVITLLLKLKQEGALVQKKALVVAPTGLLTNWQQEIKRFAPSLSVMMYHGGKRSVDTFTADILLTSYGVLRSDSALIKKERWEIMVIDEAQNIKNHTAAQSKAVRSIPATTYIAMSGTPVENRLSEFWTLMDFVNHGYLGTEKQFSSQYAQPIQCHGDQQVCERFKKVTAPFIMRRLKTDKSIISDLPDKIEHDEYILLTPGQAALYQQTLEEAMKGIEDIKEGEDTQAMFKRQGLILQMIMALKQICNHPTQFLKDDNRKAELSGKTMWLLDWVQSIVESHEKVLIFTQFKEMGNLLSTFIQERLGQAPMFYHGGCTIKQRNSMVTRFQNDRTEQVFILSLKAAGTGLNLTAATHVIHYDLWWNPAVEAQATDRAYRIGQHKNVQVHRLITRNTFEEKINRMIQEKRHLAEWTVTSGENWIGKLSNQELRELFG